MSGGFFKDKLIYDAASPSDGDSVAAYLRTGSAALTSTTIGPIEALDVNIASPLSVDVQLDGLYDVGTNPDPDTIGHILRTRGAAPDETTQVEPLTGAAASADALVAADVHGMDTNGFMHIFNGTTWDRVRGTSGSMNVSALGNVADDAVDSGNPMKVGTRALSGVLTAVSTTGDRADMISDLYRRLRTNSTPNISGANAAVSIADTAGGTAVFASPALGRCRVQVQNNSATNKPIWLGFGTVTIANGIRLNAGASWTEEIGPDLALKAITDTGVTNDVRVMQLA